MKEMTTGFPKKPGSSGNLHGGMFIDIRVDAKQGWAKIRSSECSFWDEIDLSLHIQQCINLKTSYNHLTTL